MALISTQGASRAPALPCKPFQGHSPGGPDGRVLSTQANEREQGPKFKASPLPS